MSQRKICEHWMWTNSFFWDSVELVVCKFPHVKLPLNWRVCILKHCLLSTFPSSVKNSAGKSLGWDSNQQLFHARADVLPLDHQATLARNSLRIYVCQQNVCFQNLLKVLSEWSVSVIGNDIDQLKTIDTIGNCQRPVFSLGVWGYIK